MGLALGAMQNTVYLSSLDFHACQLDVERMAADFVSHGTCTAAGENPIDDTKSSDLAIPVYFLVNILQYTCAPISYVLVVCLFD